MRPVFSKLTIAIMLLVGIQLTSIKSAAQVSQADKEKLTEVSRIRVIDGNTNFLIVELMKDGFLKENEDINLQYSAKKVTLNGKDIPEPYNDRYTQMLLTWGFINSGWCTSSIRAGGQTISKLIEETPSTRDHARHTYRQNYYRLQKLLIEDGIAGNAGDVIIDIAADYVAVNGRILATPIEKAYEYHFRELSGFKPGEGEVFSMVIKHTSKK